MDLRTLITILSLVLFSSSYNIKINPVVKTSVQNIKNSGDHNTIQLSTITNSTILQAAVPHQIYQSHLNQLYSTSAILVIFSVLFIIISVIITKANLSDFQIKLKAQPPWSENSVNTCFCRVPLEKQNKFILTILVKNLFF